MSILNIAGYKFTNISDLNELREQLWAKAQGLKGTILLSEEGINLSLAGETQEVTQFVRFLHDFTAFSDMTFRQSYSDQIPFKRLKIKLKKEIITLRKPNIHPKKKRGPSISPEILKQWLDENRDFILLDTRNDYEVQFGTFLNAVNLELNDFSEFPEAAKKIPANKPIVMFCTGGIRCEKASLQLLDNGFSEVYQLEGGILNYFAEVGGAHYQGDCFVFDERVALNVRLEKSGIQQCKICQKPFQTQNALSFISDTSCPKCLN